MSSCDSVSPTTFGAGAVHSEGVTYTPHKSSSQPLALGDHPNNWRAIVPRTELLGLFGSVSKWPRASRSSSHVGGMSGHTLNSPVVLGCACWWLSLVWLGAGASSGCLCFSLACGFLVVSSQRGTRKGTDPITGSDLEIT